VKTIHANATRTTCSKTEQWSFIQSSRKSLNSWVNQAMNLGGQSVRAHAAQCVPMRPNARPCASMRAHASFSTTAILC